MKFAPIPFDEMHRLVAVHRTKLLDSRPEERFDRLTRLTQHIFDVPFVFITLVDRDRVWFKSKFGCDVSEEPRDLSFCGHTICNVITDKLSSRIFEVIDAKEDDRFKDNTFIIDECRVRYYMGFVLQSFDQRNIGTLCITDVRPRRFSIEEKYIFIDLGMMIEKELNNDSSTNNIVEENYPRLATADDTLREKSPNKFLELTSKLQTVMTQFNENLRNTGITYRDWYILNAIMEFELATPHLLSKKLGITPPSITRRLDDLEIKNLIIRQHSTDGDRRTVHIECSDRGLKLWRRGIIEACKLENMHLSAIINLNCSN